MLRCLSLVGAVIVVCQSVHARVLDDFAKGVEATSRDGNVFLIKATGLDPLTTIGGERDVAFEYSIVNFIDLPVFARRAGFPQGISHYSGLDPGYGEFSYGKVSPLSVDLTADGSSEFRITVEGEYATLRLQNATLRVMWLERMGATMSAVKSFGDFVTSAGNVTTGRIPFVTYGELSNVTSLTLRFDYAMVPLLGRDLSSFFVRQFVTGVPEPASGTLLSLGLVTLFRQSASKVLPRLRRGRRPWALV